MDWKIILILVVLVGIVLIICWYSCPSRENYNIPWRPKDDSYKAPNPGFYYPTAENPPEGPYIGCSDSKEFSIEWACDYSTTIYTPNSVHFNLTTIGTLSGGTTPLLPINSNIGPSDVDMDNTNKPIIQYRYTYYLGEYDNLKPGEYILHLNSFIPQSENVSDGQKTDSNITEGSMIIYNNYAEDVTLVTVNDGDGIADEFYAGENIIVEWQTGTPSFPPLSVNYEVCLVSAGECVGGTIQSGITGTSYTYSELDLIGQYTAVVKTTNEYCKTTTNGSSSDLFTIDYPPVPIPTIISLSSFSSQSCTYTSTAGAHGNELIIYWCVDFTDYPEYNPNPPGPGAGDPDFIIDITGDVTHNFQLDDDGVVEDHCEGDICFYQYNFGVVDIGIYTITLTTNASYKGGDKYLSEPSKPTTYTISCLNDDQCIDGNVCIDNTCVQCRDNSQCGGSTPTCNPKSNICINCPECPGDGDCPAGCINCHKCLIGKSCDPESNTCVNCPECGDCPSRVFILQKSVYWKYRFLRKWCM